MIVTRCDVGGQRPKRVERRFAALLELLVHVDLDLVQRHVAGAFDHDLTALLPRDLRELAERLEFGELRAVVGVGDRARTQAVAERERYVVLAHQVADFLEVSVEEALLVVRKTPLRHDRAAARHDAGDAVGGEVDVGQAHAGVDGEVIDALFALFNERVAVKLPGQLDRIAVALLQRLIDRHGADRNRRVAQNPFARGVDVAAGGEVHHGVGTPADCPHHLVHFLLDRGGDGGVADVGVDLGQEVAADDHRLQLGVVDVAGDDGAAARDLAAHEFRGDEQRHFGAERFTVGAGGFRALKLLLAAEVLALGDVDHLLGDDAGAREFELGDRRIADTAHRLVVRLEGSRGVLGADIAVVLRLDLAALIFLDAAALLHPGHAGAGQTGVDVDQHVRVGVGAGGIVHRQVRLARAFGKDDLAQRHAQVGRRVGRRENLARRRQGTGGDGSFDIGDRLVHGILLEGFVGVIPGGSRSEPIRNLEVENC
ncbi:hypothetical protein BN961_02393 [Afipia felis]|uniref:NAD-specific glutamate dehydrogenase n=1 Tax=Afipia felis TaxID=1035 RepID=A0A090MRZ0_AFIFE|nr:hypothetical protein BN961_02393 [Afipia felis]